MTISSRTPDGLPNRCQICRKRLRLSPSWPTWDAPCPHCGSLVWFPADNALSQTTKEAPAPEYTLDHYRAEFKRAWKFGGTREIMAQMRRDGEITSMDEDAEVIVRRILGMIDSMTKEERRNPDVIDPDRCRRIAAGSACATQDVEQLLMTYSAVRIFRRRLQKSGFAW